jgi:EpsI family protein
MFHIKLSHVILGLAMCLAASLTLALKPTKKLADQSAAINLETMIPAQFGEWKADSNAQVSIKPSADVQANLDKIYDQILNRNYVNAKGQQIMLTITYGSSQTQDLKAHRQEVCYAAQGFQIQAIKHEVLRIAQQMVPVTQMLAVKQQRSEPVTYWFTMGDNVVLSRFERMMVNLKYSFAGVIPDGVLVRVSNLTLDANQGYIVHQEFIDDLMKSLDKKSMQKLLGGGA